MGADISTVLNFEGAAITMVRNDSGKRIIRATDLCAPTGRKKRAVLQLVAQLDPSERCAFQMHTLGGPQEVTFLTESGALKVLAAGRTPACARLRDVLVDYFLADRDGESVVRQLMVEMKALRAEVEDLKRPAMRPLQHGSKRYGPADLHLLTPQEETRLWRDGFCRSSAFLQEITKEKPRGPIAGGLTNRTVSLCRRKGWEVRRYLQSGRVITFLSKRSLQLAFDGSEGGIEVEQMLLNEGDKAS